MSAADRPRRTSVRAKTTTVAWLAHAELTLEEWRACGSRLGVVSKSTNWWLGDWVRFGLARYGQRYELAAAATGYDEQTLMNMAYVAKQFDVSRRRENLSWSHHAELAALEPAEQETWLDRAGAERLSVRDLRRAVAGTKRKSADLALSGHISQHGGRDDIPLVSVTCPECGSVLNIADLLRGDAAPSHLIHREA